MSAFDRRSFMAWCSAAGLTSTLFPGALYAEVRRSGATDDHEITVEMIAEAEKVAGLSFTAEQRALMLEDLQDNLEHYKTLRAMDLPNHVVPALLFDPTVSGEQPHPPEATAFRWDPKPVARPAAEDDLAFLTVAELAYLLRNGDVTSTALTQLYLRRLKQYDPLLKAVVTLTEERALRQAAAADAEIRAGHFRSPVHGIPWGAKDLLAVEGYPTTWGAVPYKDQVLEQTATVVQTLDEAGAVLVAKLTLGALAWGDVWFGGRTNNPWNIEQGSSGSSAGPGSAVAAGLVGFALGTETLGSIVSPSTRNGVTGHRPTFGRVSRHGAMALSWSMDKIGPMCRSAEDCALVFSVIEGRDLDDPYTRDARFRWPLDPQSLRVGYQQSAFDLDYRGAEEDRAAVDVLREQGFALTPVALPDMPVGPLLLTLNAEAAAAFDTLTLSGDVDRMVRQSRRAWPNAFRTARFTPAVDYINANRARTLLMQQMAEVMRDIDVFVTPSYGGGVLQITNLTGHPQVAVPNAFYPIADQPDSPRRQPSTISFVGGLYQDDAALALAAAYQSATDFHRRRPPIE